MGRVGTEPNVIWISQNEQRNTQYTEFEVIILTSDHLQYYAYRWNHHIQLHRL